jgi:hypothetical protein
MLLNQKQLFSKTECDTILNLSKENIKLWNAEDRKYNSYPINYSEDTKWIFDKLSYFFEKQTGLKIIKMKKQIHFHKFIKGDWFGKHTDERDTRLYAIGVLLNDDFDGGEFKLYNPNEYRLDKKTGNTYIFDVKIEHEITQIISGERYSLLWFLQNDHIKIHTNKLI